MHYAPHGQKFDVELNLEVIGLHSKYKLFCCIQALLDHHPLANCQINLNLPSFLDSAFSLNIIPTKLCQLKLQHSHSQVMVIFLPCSARTCLYNYQTQRILVIYASHVRLF